MCVCWELNKFEVFCLCVCRAWSVVSRFEWCAVAHYICDLCYFFFETGFYFDQLYLTNISEKSEKLIKKYEKSIMLSEKT